MFCIKYYLISHHQTTAHKLKENVNTNCNSEDENKEVKRMTRMKLSFPKSEMITLSCELF